MSTDQEWTLCLFCVFLFFLQFFCVFSVFLSLPISLFSGEMHLSFYINCMNEVVLPCFWQCLKNLAKLVPITSNPEPPFFMYRFSEVLETVPKLPGKVLFQ